MRKTNRQFLTVLGLLTIIFTMGLFGFLKGQPKRFISEAKHKENVTKQTEMNNEILHQLSLYGVTQKTELKIEYFFYTDTKDKADKLNADLKKKNYETVDVHQVENLWSVSGWTSKLNMDLRVVTNWTVEMCELGFSFDCEFDGWGTHPQQDPPMDIQDGLTVDEYFNKALEYYHGNDLVKSEAFFSKVIEITPDDAEAYYNRGMVKSARGNKLGAIGDFDKAIEADPQYEYAYGNRGADKDDIGDFEGAIADYNKIIELSPNSSLAYFNRGNTNYRMGNKDKACMDWTKAKELGDETVQQRLDQYCN